MYDNCQRSLQDPVLDYSIDALAAEMRLAQQRRDKEGKAASQRSKLGVKD